MPIPQTQTEARMLDERRRLKIKAYFEQRPPRTLYQYAKFFEAQLPPEAYDPNSDYETERINLAWHNYYNAMHCQAWNAHYHGDDVKEWTWNAL